jgi:P27 family predicted phage terminase small subunit
MKGGRRKHPKLTSLEGGRGRRPATPPRPEPMTKKNEFPVPRWLPKEAKSFIRRYKPLLIRNNILTPWDWDSFVTMALLSSEIRRHTEALEEEKWVLEGRQKGLVKNPRSSLLRSAQREFRLFCNEFGLTPRGRAGLDIKIIEDKEDDLSSGVPRTWID